MNSGPIHIRRLASDDAVLYRDIRLEALRQELQAFGSTFEAENLRSLTWFADRLDSSDVLGAFRKSDLLGVAGFVVQQGPKQAHKGRLWGMYVRPHARKNGIGRRLGDAIIDLARSRVELIQLTVVADNLEARRLYESLGFLQYGIEKRGLKQGSRYYDEVLMWKDLVSV